MMTFRNIQIPLLLCDWYAHLQYKEMPCEDNGKEGEEAGGEKERERGEEKGKGKVQGFILVMYNKEHQRNKQIHLYRSTIFYTKQ